MAVWVGGNTGNSAPESSPGRFRLAGEPASLTLNLPYQPSWAHGRGPRLSPSRAHHPFPAVLPNFDPCLNDFGFIGDAYCFGDIHVS